MKDTFGRDVSVGDTIVYGTRTGSSQYLTVARVLEIKNKNREKFSGIVEYMICKPTAGNNYNWKYGLWNYPTQTRLPYVPKNVRIMTSHNFMIANGINVEEIEECARRQMKID